MSLPDEAGAADVMHDRPTALELIEAVTEFLAGEVAPALEDRRLRFRALVAINALGIAYRELDEASDTASLAGEGARGAAGAARDTVLQGEQELRELAARIRAGAPPPEALALLKAHVAAKLRVSNPRALEKY